jgi:metal-dependent amidase/aminoacylase/carboxypeptidase family protein
VFIDPFTVEFVDALGIEACNNHPMMGKLPFDTSNPEKLNKYQRAAVRMVGAPNSNLAEKCAAIRKTVLPKGLPVRLITSGRNWLRPEEQKIWREAHERLTASIEGAKLLVAEQSNHAIPFIQPDLVVSVVKEVVDENIHAQISKKAESVFASLVELRRDIHEHPELSGKETRTSALVKKYLMDLGLEVKTNVGGFGVVGILKGANSGPVVAWRADMDALADNSPDNVAFKSTNPGLKHSCGHDVHTTIALGIANVLSSLKTKLKGTVLFIFEPSEENFLGAKAMLADGLFGQLKPDAILALHLGPLPAGTVVVKPEEMFACRTKITIGLKNLINEEEALNICAGLLNALNAPPGLNVFSVSLDESENGIFNPRGLLTNYFALGDSPKIERQGDSGHAVEVRALSSSLANVESAVAKLQEALGNSKLKDNVQTIEYSLLQPPVYNHPELTAKSLKIIQALYGNNSIMPFYGVIPGFNDDFAFFQKEIKGVYFFLGGSNFEKGVVSMPHAPNFEVDESCIKTGTAIFSSLLFELTGN